MEIELICNHSSKTKYVWVARLFLLLTMLSCSTQKNLINRSKTGENKVLGGYEASSYMDENDSQDSVTISGKVTEAKTKRKVPSAEIRFLDSDGNTLKELSSDTDGSFHTKLPKLTKFGSIEIDGNSAGFLTIANIDFGIFVNNIKIKARLFKYDYSATELDFSKKED